MSEKRESCWHNPAKLHYVTYDRLPNGKVVVPGDAKKRIKWAIFDNEWDARQYIAKAVGKSD